MNTPKQTMSQMLKNSEMILQGLRGGMGEVYAHHTTKLSVVYECNDFSVSKSNSTSAYGVRTIVNGKLGFMACNSDEESTLCEVAGETKKLAQLSLPSEFHQISESKKNGSYENYDEALDEPPMEKIYQWMQQVVDEAHREKEVSLDRAKFSCTRNLASLSNSNGVSQQSLKTNCSWFAMGMAKTKSEVTSFDYDGGTVWNHNNVASEITETIGRFRESVMGSLGARPAKDYQGVVLLHPEAVVDFLKMTISFNTNGKNHCDGISSWKDKMGQPVGSELLQVSEDPLDKNRSSGWSPFDREGVLTAPHEIIQQGRLNFVAHNCFSARQAGVSPTGNALGGVTTLPGIGFSNLTISGTKTASEENLYKELETVWF